jgi:hypothetical protein
MVEKRMDFFDGRSAGAVLSADEMKVVVVGAVGWGLGR